MESLLLHLGACLLFCWFFAPIAEALVEALAACVGAFLVNVGLCCGGVILLASAICCIVFVARRGR